MEVIGHDHKFMQQKPPFSTIRRENIHQKLSHAIGLKKRAASGRRRGHEKRTGGLGSLGHSHPGLKPGLCKIECFRGFENPWVQMGAMKNPKRDGYPVLVRQGRLLAATFHPELSSDRRVHQLFVNMVRDQRNSHNEDGPESCS